ncbi:MAG: TfoX/Sxy family protein [Rhodocyclaceae bacterium]|nr:TfoX/Sxy family protein [Rhodocyclaceae bacterium]
MAYDEGAAQRLREHFAGRGDVAEKHMFGGIAFMVAGRMTCCVVGDTLMVRVGPDGYGESLARPHVRPMDFTGRPMKGYLYVDPPGFAEDRDLAAWVGMAEAFVATLPPK